MDDLASFPLDLAAAPPTGLVELVADAEHFQRVVREGMLKAAVSLDLMTADLKAMLVPRPGSREAPSVIQHLVRLARRGVEVRVLHAGVPSGPALAELRKGLPPTLTFRRCPRLHAKAVVIDAASLYLGSANLTGAGLGAKHADKRNFELGVLTTAPPLIDAVLDRFNQLWEGARCQTCRRREVCPEPLEEPDLTPG